MKNKGLRQSHTFSRILEAIDVWKVAGQPPIRRATIIPFRKENVFLRSYRVRIAISQSSPWFKASLERFSRMK